MIEELESTFTNPCIVGLGLIFFFVIVYFAIKSKPKIK